jgi:hypothetical protein
MPFTFFISNDAFYYGVLQAYRGDRFATQIARTSHQPGRPGLNSRKRSQKDGVGQFVPTFADSLSLFAVSRPTSD